jgi:hypothetical protein
MLLERLKFPTAQHFLLAVSLACCFILCCVSASEVDAESEFRLEEDTDTNKDLSSRNPKCKKLQYEGLRIT